MNSSNSTIAKNTLMLYIRMLLKLGVSLYTVRIVLEVLGVEDYGIFNVVGGLTYLFTILTSTMSTASQRFFSFELGKKDSEQLQKTFSATIIIYLIFGLLVIIIGETIGLWFLKTQMTIPSDRMVAAHWVYQITIVGFLINMITIPYNAAIIAHERMNIYAYVGVLEVVLKLIIVYLLILVNGDKLIIYSVLWLAVTFIVTIIYVNYCNINFSECKLILKWDKRLFSKLLSFSSWNLFGSSAGILKSQGTNILLNIFFGPALNASRGIAVRIDSAIRGFVHNFLTAVRPQITKKFAADKKDSMMNLVFSSSKLSFFLLLVLSTTVIYETKYLLETWLPVVPEFTVIFTRLIIINSLIDTISYPLMTAAQATGKIKKYQSVIGSTLLLNVPVSYIFLKLGYPPYVTLIIAIILSVIALGLRLHLLKNLIGLDIVDFSKKVMVPIAVTSTLIAFLPLIINIYLEESFFRLVLNSITILLSSVVVVYYLGLNIDERSIITGFVKKLKLNPK